MDSSVIQIIVSELELIWIFLLAHQGKSFSWLVIFNDLYFSSPYAMRPLVE